MRYRAVILVCSLVAFGCYSPKQSQDYFLQAAAKDRALEPIYSTAIYTVYFDYALQRCVLHSAHTWGEGGGGGGGTGIGVSAFRCDPARIRARASSLGLQVFPPHYSVWQNPTEEGAAKAPAPRKEAPPRGQTTDSGGKR